jgi:hypothetical protein
MTLTEMDAILPNGFHDAQIERMTWDFQTNSAVFDVDFWVGSETSDREARRKSRIHLRNILFIAIDPPSPRDSDPKPYRFKPDSLAIDGEVANERIFPQLNFLKGKLPSDVEIFSFYVLNWNSFIHISAEAELIWK